LTGKCPNHEGLCGIWLYNIKRSMKDSPDMLEISGRLLFLIVDGITDRAVAEAAKFEKAEFRGVVR
jgi:hypothetical protein